MAYKLRTVKQMVEEEGVSRKMSYYDPAQHEREWATMNGHDIAAWTLATTRVIEGLREAGYSNPTLVDWDRTLLAVVDEDADYYKHDNRRPSLYDIAAHCGMGAGCAWNNTVQLISLPSFLERGLDETHGRRGWTTAPCKQCFPAEHAAAVAGNASVQGSGSDRPTGERLRESSYRVPGFGK